MPSRIVPILLASLLVTGGSRLPAQLATSNFIRIVIETDHGTITAVLDSAHAPITVANFMHFVNARVYDDGRFYRTVTSTNQPNDSVRIAVIQGGVNPARPRSPMPPIPLERTSVTGIKHHDGTLSMARSTANTATTEFFICIGDQPALDFGGHRNPDGQGFSAFGQVTSGMDVVRAIHGLPANALQRLTTPVVIKSIHRATGKE